jgi:hypothetical protein
MSPRKRRRQPPSLDGFDVKVQRARVHLDALNKAVADIDRHRVSKLVGQIDPGDNRKHLYRIKNPPAPDPQWSAIAGDCIHALRSALDYLASELVRVSGGSPNVHTMFPISDFVYVKRRCPFLRLTGYLTGRKPKAAEIRGGIRGDILQVVESVQPYNRGNPVGERLRVLRELDNIDKHRQLLMTTTVIPAIRQNLDLTFGPPRFDYRAEGIGEVLEHDKVAIKLTFSQPNQYLRPDLKLSFTVAFLKRERLVGGKYVTRVLEDLCAMLDNDIKPLFAPFF